MILLVDNYDSFTYNLFQYLRMLGRETRVVRNDAITVTEVEEIAPELIVISPGPGTPNGAGVSLALVSLLSGKIPIVGVCLGMQVIAQAFGARIGPAALPVHGKVRSVTHDGRGLFRGLANPLNVTRYHSLIVEEDGLPDCLEVTARSESGEIMGLRHRDYQVEGVQFHPEAYLTESGLELLGNALKGGLCVSEK